MRPCTACRGFTLLELVVVIVILAILALGTTQFITNTIDAYQDTARREQLSSAARIAIEKVVREVRNAHPSSIRVLDGGNCVQFLPILASGSYQDQSLSYGPGMVAPAQLPVTTPGTAFDAFGVTPPAGSTYVLAGSGDPYALANPGPLTAYNGTNSAVPLPAGVVRILIPNHRFATHSPARRFYLAGAPVGFCVQGGGLYRHSGFGLNDGAPWPLASGSLIVEDITGGPYFSYSGSTTSRNALLGIAVGVAVGDESILLDHEVQIRNVP